MKKAKKRNRGGWNYRVIRHPGRKIGKIMSESYLAIHEVYYTDDIPTSCSTEPVNVLQESDKDDTKTLKILKKDLKLMKKALKEPILDFSVFDGTWVLKKVKPLPPQAEGDL